MAFGARSPAQWRSAISGKLDGALADIARHAHLARPDHALADLRSLSLATRFASSPKTAEPLVLVDAVTRGDPQRLRSVLIGLGLEHPALYLNDVSGWLPVRQIDATIARPEVAALRASMPRTRVGAVTSQGDFAQGSRHLRTLWPALDGSGVMVGILSDSFNCYAVYAAPSGVPASGHNGYARNGFTADAAHDISTGDLPASVNVLEEAGAINNDTCRDFGAPLLPPYGDEGRAMLQIVHDVAPGASLAFHTAAEGEADFANGITALAAAGAKVIADDVGYADEPFFQDSLVSQAIDTVESQGVAYFTAAGNDGNLAYENMAPSFNTLSTSAPNAGEMLLNFDTTGASTNDSLPVTIPRLIPGELVLVVVEWDQPYLTGGTNNNPIANGRGSSNQIDLCEIGAAGNDEILDLATGKPAACTGLNALGTDPVQVLVIGNPASNTGNSTPQTLSFQIGLGAGSTPPGRIKLVVEDDGAGSQITSFATMSPTLQGHASAAGAAAVGAAFFQGTPLCGSSPAMLESFSALGGDPILFDANGNRLASPVFRHKPDFVGPDGVNNTFLGFVVNSSGNGVPECSIDGSFPSFFGTSAATPHVAAVAALMMQANSALTPAQIYAALQSTAAAMGNTTPNPESGYGFIQADAALAALPPGPPTLSLAETSITVGNSTSLSWSASNVTACTASGSWSGAQLTSGSLMITPMTAGTASYTLTCGNAHGSAQRTATLSVAAAAGSGGGGALGAALLLALCGLVLARVLTPAPVAAVDRPRLSRPAAARAENRPCPRPHYCRHR